eukprot:9490487-Pyramimonas_sp.AAC.2
MSTSALPCQHNEHTIQQSGHYVPIAFIPLERHVHISSPHSRAYSDLGKISALLHAVTEAGSMFHRYLIDDQYGVLYLANLWFHPIILH